MIKKMLISAVVVLLVLFGGIILFSNQETPDQLSNGVNDQPAAEEQTKDDNDQTEPNEQLEESLDTPPVQQEDSPELVQTAFVAYTNQGFEPVALTVDKGTKVVFKNESNTGFWPASNTHPTHTVYPGSGIEKCGTSQESLIFDACGSVEPGGSYSFTFEQTGTWGYHDHFNPSEGGEIVVK